MADPLLSGAQYPNLKWKSMLFLHPGFQVFTSFHHFHRSRCPCNGVCTTLCFITVDIRLFTSTTFWFPNSSIRTSSSPKHSWIDFPWIYLGHSEYSSVPFPLEKEPLHRSPMDLAGFLVVLWPLVPILPYFDILTYISFLQSILIVLLGSYTVLFASHSILNRLDKKPLFLLVTWVTRAYESKSITHRPYFTKKIGDPKK